MALEGEEARLTSPAWSHVSAEAKQLVSAMLERRVDRRLTADEVLRHPWLASAMQAERARAEAPPSAGPRALLAPGALAAAVVGAGASQESDMTKAEVEVTAMAAAEVEAAAAGTELPRVCAAGDFAGRWVGADWLPFECRVLHYGVAQLQACATEEAPLHLELCPQAG